MAKISQTQDRLLALGIITAIQYTVKPSPMFWCGSIALYLVDWQMRTVVIEKATSLLKDEKEFMAQAALYLWNIISFAARASFTYYVLKPLLSTAIESMGYNSDFSRALIQSALALASSSQLELCQYHKDSTEVGSSKISNTLKNAINTLVFYWFEPKMEFKNSLMCLLATSLTFCTTNYLTNTSKKNSIEISLQQALTHSAIDLAASTIVTNVANLALTDAAGRIARHTLCVSVSTVGLYFIKG